MPNEDEQDERLSVHHVGPGGSAGLGDVRIRMKGGDAGTADAPGQPGFVEIEPVKCSCEWSIMDTGNQFYSRIARPDPDCAVHRR